MTDPVTIGYGANKWVKDANTKALSLTKSAVGTAYGPMISDGVIYQVPVGKKFTVLKVSANIARNGSTSGAIAGIWNVNHATTTTGGGNKILEIFYVIGAGVSSPTTVGTEFDLYIEVPAGEYITMRSGNASSYLGMTLFGVEDNA